MENNYTPGTIGIKIHFTPSIAKSIAIVRKYNPVSMAEIKTQIESKDYVLISSFISHPGVRIIRKCYDELSKAGNVVEIYEHNRLTTRDFLSNLINSHKQTDREVQAQVDAEVEADNNNN